MDLSASRKRQASPTPPKRRVKPTHSGYATFRVSNIENNETVHHKCLLLTGDCPSFENSAEDYIAIATTDAFSQTTSPQHWPTGGGGRWRALVMLSTGTNQLSIKLWHSGGISGEGVLNVNYIPLTQVPPLHLAIMVAKDSPLVVPCPPSKFGAISSAHSGLEAVIKKFRMTACMWQAALAEQTRVRSGIRRTFRLEEEWSVDSTKQMNRHGPSANSTMDSIAKIHIVRTERRVAEIQNGGQPDSSASWQRHYHGRQLGPREMFAEALRAYGGPLAPQHQPLIAGLVLDSHWDADFGSDGIERGVAPQDAHVPRLAMCGNQDLYSWPRFTEEVSSCLLDKTAADDINPGNELRSTGEICQSSQAGLLEAISRGLGIEDGEEHIPHDMCFRWKAMFMASDLGALELESQCSLRQVLQLRLAPQLRMACDDPRLRDRAFRQAEITACVEAEADMYQDEGVEDHQILVINCNAGLAEVIVHDASGHQLTRVDYTRWVGWETPPRKECRINLSTLPNDADHGSAASAWVVAGNGKARNINISALMRQLQKNHLSILGTSLRLDKTSVRARHLSHDSIDYDDDDCRHVPWHILFSHADPATGAVSGVESIDLRVGACFDGIVVRYEDGHVADNRPCMDDHYFGGHLSQKQEHLGGSVEIVRVEIPSSVDGIRITLASGVVFGDANEQDPNEIAVLEPRAGEKIVGFFGLSTRGNGWIEEFGILTMPAGASLPRAAYSLVNRLNNRSAGSANHEAEGKEAPLRPISVDALPPQQLTKFSLAIPGSTLYFNKISARPQSLNKSTPGWRREHGYKPWAFLFTHRNPSSGCVAGLSYVSLRVGSTFDGIIVGYEDGARADNRPWTDDGRFGGGKSRTQEDLRGEADVVKVELNPISGMYGFSGIHLTLADGTVFGTLNEDHLGHDEEEDAIVVLEPEKEEKVVGFFGTSDGFDGYVFEFGILTLPRGEEVPEEAYGMEEFRRSGQGGQGERWDDCEDDVEDDSEGTQCWG